MKQIACATLFVCLAILAASAVMAPSDYLDQFGGDLQTYLHIFSLSSCAALEEAFDRFEEECKRLPRDHAKLRERVGYMTAVADRLERLGCERGYRLAGARNEPAGRSHPADRSLAAFKAWIKELSMRFTTTREAIQLSEQEWMEAWADYWSKKPHQ